VSDTPNPEPIAVGLDAAAELLGITEAHLRRFRTELRIPCFRIGSRLLFPVRELRDWAAAQAEPEQPQAAAA